MDKERELKQKFTYHKQVSHLYKFEIIVYRNLVKRYGVCDVFYQYGVHPRDKRYPFNCDFYVKSQDLFIELNLGFKHGEHWFNQNNCNDVNRLNNLIKNGSRKDKIAIKTWRHIDLIKEKMARKHKLNYLVFWDGTCQNKKRHYKPNLCDFYDWFNNYNCNYVKFIHDHPENTYRKIN